MNQQNLHGIAGNKGCMNCNIGIPVFVRMHEVAGVEVHQCDFCKQEYQRQQGVPKESLSNPHRIFLSTNSH